MLEEALVLVSPMAADANIELKPLPNLPDEIGVVADRQRLIQVLLNLLSNAIKYNRPAGQVRIEIEQTAEQVTVSVVDTGYGLRQSVSGSCSNRSNAWTPTRVSKGPGWDWR